MVINEIVCFLFVGMLFEEEEIPAGIISTEPEEGGITEQDEIISTTKMVSTPTPTGSPAAQISSIPHIHLLVLLIVITLFTY